MWVVQLSGKYWAEMLVAEILVGCGTFLLTELV